MFNGATTPEINVFNLMDQMSQIQSLMPRHRIGPGQYTHASLHKQIKQSRYTGEMLREIRRDPTKR